MDYKLKKKVQNLRKIAFDQFFKMIESDEHFEIEIIDSILSILLSFDQTFPKVSDCLQDSYEMGYYDFEEMYDKKDITIKIALDLKKEIFEKLEYNEDLFNSHEKINYSFDEDDGIDITEILYAQIRSLLSNYSILKNLLAKHKDLKFENSAPLIKSLNDMYSFYSDIYADYREFGNDEDEPSDNYDSEYEDEDDDSIESPTEEDFEDKWKNICNFNYDIGLIDDVYCSVFGEIKEEQRVLIGLMVSDFYEYHKCLEEMYTLPDNKDILDTINYIECHTYEEIIKYFSKQPTWSCFIVDTYIYYNTSFTEEEKLSNRMTIRNMGNLHILKNNNKFIEDNLKDETLYNSFILSISELIRSSNYSIFYRIDSTDNAHTNDLLFKYFTSDFVPENIEDDIPKLLRDIDIKNLKRLQLRFIISDFFARKLSQNNSDIEVLLNYSKPDGLYNSIATDEKRLKYILKNFSDELQKDDEINLSKEQKQKLIKFNILTAFDNF